MEFPNQQNGAQFWTTQNERRFDTPGDSHHQLNPSVPRFQPNPIGTDLQRYQTLPPTPPGSNMATSGEMVQIKNYMLSSHFNHTREMTGLERRAQKTEDDIEDMKGATRRDLQTLQGEISELKAGKKQPHSGMVGSFDEDSVAEMYLDEAETLEQTAAKLRQQAEQMSTRAVSHRRVTMKMLEGPKDSTIGYDSKAEFACCGENFETVKQMMDHINTTHGRMEQPQPSGQVVEVSGDSTPTHMPARRAKPNNALEIKAPGSDGQKTPKLQTSEPVEDASKAENEEVKKDGEATKVTTSIIDAEVPISGPEVGSNEDWTPLAVRQMESAPVLDTSSNDETFTWEFLTQTFAGTQWSPGYYFIPEKSDLLSHSYWMLESDYEPYIPSSPGQHGAKLTAFFNNTIPASGPSLEEENFQNVPVFIRPQGKREYVYYGNYSQKRFSDKLDYDHVNETVPAKIREYWADQLAAEGRPKWVTEELRQHFWPQPKYNGPIPTDSALNTPTSEATEETGSLPRLEKRVQQALVEYAWQLKEWKKDTDMKLQRLTTENLLKSFGTADADVEPGLRLWWEYLQCEGYDQGFYDFLVQMKALDKGRPARGRMPTRGPVQALAKVVKRLQEDEEETVKPPSPPKVQRAKNTAATPTWTAGAKPHTAGTQPWEQNSGGLKTGGATSKTGSGDSKPAPNGMGGDLGVAKAFQAGLKKNYANGNGVKLPPHLRKK